ncbi:MAG: hypothetical protein LBS14_01695, partial [Holosporaceae bacterium]|nr:hypothetical protein [Holosporaceae bacterium]
NRKQETGNRKQETGNRKQETGNRKQETGNRKQETGNRKQRYLFFAAGLIVAPLCLGMVPDRTEAPEKNAPRTAVGQQFFAGNKEQIMDFLNNGKEIYVVAENEDGGGPSRTLVRLWEMADNGQIATLYRGYTNTRDNAATDFFDLWHCAVRTGWRDRDGGHGLLDTLERRYGTWAQHWHDIMLGHSGSYPAGCGALVVCRRRDGTLDPNGMTFFLTQEAHRYATECAAALANAKA